MLNRLVASRAFLLWWSRACGLVAVYWLSRALGLAS
jgi:hypothetical protein